MFGAMCSKSSKNMFVFSIVYIFSFGVKFIAPFGTLWSVLCISITLLRERLVFGSSESLCPCFAQDHRHRAIEPSTTWYRAGSLWDGFGVYPHVTS